MALHFIVAPVTTRIVTTKRQCFKVVQLYGLPSVVKSAPWHLGIYRREGWEVPLGAALLELRECAARLKLHEVFPPRP